MTTKLTAADANTYLEAISGDGPAEHVITEMDEGLCIMRLVANETHLRPGGYISGPTQMSIADSAAYFAVMTLTGLEPMTVTSNLSINFLRPCIGDTLICTARVMKIGKALAVMDVDLRIKDAAKPSSHAVVTYAIPREPSALAT